MYDKIFKRVLDIIISLTALLILLPLFIPIVFILKFTGEGEVLYFQKRVGKNLIEFEIIKFATMLKNSPNLGDGIYTADEDFRILKFGKFLRKTKINELPQIFNILFGNMSIVGPRPLIKETFKFYKETERKKISSIKPGLTGISSIFFSQEDKILKNSKNKETFYKEKIAPLKKNLELYYINNQSFYLDFKIIVCTALKISRMSNKKIMNFFPGIKTEILKIEQLEKLIF